MKKILFLNGGNLGGAEMMTILYAKILSNAGYKCKILTHIFPGKSDQTAALIPKKISQETIKCKWRYYLIYVYFQILKYQPDIVFAWDTFVIKHVLSRFRKYHLTPSFKLVCRCPNTPSVMDSMECAGLASFKDADIVIAQTKEMETELHTIVGLNASKIITIYNPINKERIERNILDSYILDKSYTNYVATGRISEQKDYDTMLRAFALVVRQQPRSRLYICGRETNMELTNSLKQIIIEYSISDKVFFEGFQPNPHKYVKNADAYVLSSVYEGLPNAMMEAMYLGVPIAATACIPYIAQVIRDGYNGYTCPVKNPQLLSEAMLKASTLKNIPKFVDINNSEAQIITLFCSI